ncbi:hypothetical protein AU255_07010 [Methyloprofundus sedimenti]|uniref:Tyr recombinase domain-containing protein n=1 Tax=Methyloprofundus sedimenti TaxID=1420851 RepID=A0A1V8M7R9_9GAMM|nr:hypothetical protein AU255_07010 [Methyloprofundus sedimenti]
MPVAARVRPAYVPLRHTIVEQIGSHMVRPVLQVIFVGNIKKYCFSQMRSLFNVTQRLKIAVVRAAKVHSGLSKRSISPHMISHTTVMHLLKSGVDFSVIALWLGHESMTTKYRYVEADLAMKRRHCQGFRNPVQRCPL